MGRTSSRSVCTSALVAVACGLVVGIALNTATVAALFVETGETDATPLVPAMLVFLDGINSDKNEPNENYAREMMELFSLGADRGAYTEDDVREMARALTGWRSDWSAELDCLGSLTTTVSGPLAPTPKPWLMRS